MNSRETLEEALERAVWAIRSAEAILIGAGAGMGVDSGLPDFRGGSGFWNAYPPYAKLNLDFISLANPRWFVSDPELAWGFYGHRLMLYRETEPHEGYAILRKWMNGMTHGGFVLTSNVDGHFQKAGFLPEQVYEAHGSIHAMQCVSECGVGIFSSEPYSLEINLETMRGVPPLPECPRCGELARPNILMFGDWGWDSSASHFQRQHLESWLDSIDRGSIVIIECGAGKAVPTVRLFCQDIAERFDASLIRINVREAEVPDDEIALPMGALDALTELDHRLSS
jgi:NAD-dependent SIR2 family protein deacetylase